MVGSAGGSEAAERGGRYRWYVLALLGAAYACHSMDRQILAVVIEPIKHEFGASDSAMGLLGFAYALAFSAACLPVGWLIDRFERRKLLAALLSLWSGLTLICGIANSYVMLLLARMGVGAAEAGGQPICISLISDLFGRRTRSTAIGLFYLSVAIGITASFLLGGMVAAAYGWRMAFLLAGAPGLLLAVLALLTLREPPRGGQDGEKGEAVPFAAFVGVLRRSPAMIHIAIGMTLTSLTVTAMWLWVTSLMIRVHHVPLAHAGLIVAGGAVASAIGGAVLGKLADRIAGGDTRRLLLVPIAGAFACVPLGIGLAYAPSLPLAFVFLFLTAFATSAYLGPCYSVVMTIVPTGMRGLTGAALQMIINLFGSGIGPLLTGVLSDLFGGPRSIQPALAATMLINAWAAFHLWRGYRRMHPTEEAAD